ncbi:MAG: adenylate/guanylate cyclase domain-containing protein [Lachnospiraceae bacterium]|nr:adenylate/guanylate cyclase domain-containing protein [Lachnospiraceae bacterium]
MQFKKRLQTVLLTAGIIIVVMLLSYMDVMGRWDRSVSDLLNQRPEGVSHNIYIIGIDDKTLERYGMISGWGRQLSGQLIEKLNENPDARPAVIGMDIIYSEPVEEEGDSYFAEVCRKAGNVVAVSTLIFKEQPETDEKGGIVYNPYHVQNLLRPYEKLRENTGTGFANTTVDGDGYVRQAMLSADYEGETIDSFAVQIYKRYQEARGGEAVLPKTYGRGNQFYFSYSGKPGNYTMISMADVMDGTVDTRIFQDSIVLIGAYAVGMQDSFKPAVMHGSEMYGVEIHANVIQALLEGRTQLPVSKAAYAVLAGLLCGAFFLFAGCGRLLWSTAAFGGLLVGNILMVKEAYRNGYILPVLLLPVVLSLIYVGQLIQGYLAERMRRRRVVDVFKQYVAPQVVDKISKDRDFELVLGGENRHIAVLFVDIRGFTTMSESLQPEQVVEILNEYLNLTTRSIFAHDGTLDKFVGDATMAVFNAPFDLDDYIFRAVCAAWDMKQGAAAISEKFEKRFGKSVSFGIGIHCGNAVVGNIGCDFRMDYTAIGDTVNTAARLESNAKQGQILISEQVYQAVQDRIEATPIGEIPLKGKSQGVFVYQVEQIKA